MRATRSFAAVVATAVAAVMALLPCSGEALAGTFQPPGWKVAPLFSEDFNYPDGTLISALSGTTWNNNNWPAVDPTNQPAVKSNAFDYSSFKQNYAYIGSKNFGDVFATGTTALLTFDVYRHGSQFDWPQINLDGAGYDTVGDWSFNMNGFASNPGAFGWYNNNPAYTIPEDTWTNIQIFANKDTVANRVYFSYAFNGVPFTPAYPGQEGIGPVGKTVISMLDLGIYNYNNGSQRDPAGSYVLLDNVAIGVPEPSTWAITGAALACAATWVARRRLI
jgi:hypothetical protein